MSALTPQSHLEPDRVRAHTPESVNHQIDRATENAIRAGAGDRAIGRRIESLNGEWDIERVLQTNAGIAALTGIGLGAAVNKKWLIVPGVVFSFFLQHALQGWCPPVSIFRRLGVRTRREINREKYALKALRGDFNN